MSNARVILGSALLVILFAEGVSSLAAPTLSAFGSSELSCGCKSLAGAVNGNLALRGGQDDAEDGDAEDHGGKVNCFGRVFRNLFTMKNSDGPTKDGVAHFSTVLHFRLGEGGDPSLKPFLVGCHDELGQWDLSKAIPLKPGPGVGRWEGTVSFPRAESTLFFKYVLLFTNADGVPDPNRHLCPGSARS